MFHKPIAIIGGGPAGIACLESLNQHHTQALLFEKSSRLGGHCKTHQHQNHFFDEGPHVSFTPNDEVKQYLADKVNQNYHQQDFRVINFWQGNYYHHPLICHLNELPKTIRQASLEDFLNRPKSNAQDYAAWCYQTYGKTYSETFCFPYTRKYWAINPQALDTSWLKPRLYQPSTQEVIDGANRHPRHNFHYIQDVRYPIKQGFGAFFNTSAIAPANIYMNHQLKRVDTRKKLIYFSNGKHQAYSTLISSMPLPKLLDAIDDLPYEIKHARLSLYSNRCELVNIGLSRAPHAHDSHMIYYYDESLLFARINFPYRLSHHNAPAGQYSLQAEIYHSDFKPLALNQLSQRVVEQLLAIKVVRSRKDILFVNHIGIDDANILYTPERAKALPLIFDYLKSKDIYCIGRYGLWSYLWSDQSIQSGWDTARAVLEEKR